MLVLCPSRGRPDKAIEAYQSFLATVRDSGSKFLVVVDRDDPDASGYANHVPVLMVEPSGRSGMTDPINKAAASVWDDYDILGFIGDDHRFRTPGWDVTFTAALTEAPGLAYGNDLLRRNGDIATQWFVNARIVRALGYFALPACRHLYLDNAWRVLGDALGSRHYFDDVIIEHMHPMAGKAAWDAGYQRVNSQQWYDEDRLAFESWLRSGGAEADVHRVRASGMV
jgi:hypothetical protein